MLEHDEVEPGEVIGDPALLSAAMLGIEAINEVDDVEEAAARAVSDQGPGNGDRQM